MVGQFRATQPKGVEDILRMQVVGPRHRFPEAAGHFFGLDLQDERLLHMHDVRPADSFFHHLPVGAGEAIAVRVDNGLEKGEMEFRERVFRLGTVRVRVDAR